MEDLLHLYALAPDEKRPVVCFDEMPVQLLGDVVAPLEMKKGTPRREDYEYKRGGVTSTDSLTNAALTLVQSVLILF
jgi:hypothetical protein